MNYQILEPNILDYDNSSLIILDQTLLPGEVAFVHLKTQSEIWDAIYKLRVRGAPAIGIAAAFGAALLAKGIDETSFEAFFEQFKAGCTYLASSRPTAVNLFWALSRMEKCALDNSHKSVLEIKELLRAESESIKTEDIAQNLKISEYGMSLLHENDGILTHCNAGPIATSHYGTALGPILLAHERGMDVHVFADETRPLLQGARLTAFELHRAGVDVTLICDNMASIVMREGKVQLCFVGCDRVAANGDTANKIGTSAVAILAKHYGIPFYVCSPTTTIDLATPTGADIKIEQRAAREVTDMWYEKPMAPQGVKVYNPAFDVTDHELIAGIITENGIARAPYVHSLRKMVDGV